VRYPESEIRNLKSPSPMSKRNVQPITGCGEGDLAPWALLCGDPDRVPRMSSRWDEAREVCRVREFVIHTGVWQGIPVSAASTGIGGPSTAVLVEEICKLGARTLIRVGNSGALADAVELGDMVITSACVRDDGATRTYVRPEFPAASHYEVTHALVAAARARGCRHHIGTTWSTDGFFSRNKVLGKDGSLVSMSTGGYAQSDMNPMVADMKAAGVLNIEMEASTLLTLATLFGRRAGCICTVSDRTPWPGPGQDSIRLGENIETAIQIAHDAIRALHAGA